MLIGIDLDSVLADLIVSLLSHYNERQGTEFCKDDHNDYALHRVWRCSSEESKERVFDFYRSTKFDEVKPIKGCQEGIEYLKGKHNLVVITSRPLVIEKKTKSWIEKYFPKVFTGIHHTNSFSKQGKKRLKSEVCEDLGVEAMIEDSLEFAKDCLKAQVKVFLYDQPWNQSKRLPKDITRFYHWKEIEKYL